MLSVLVIDDVGVDGDDPNHIQWIMDRAVQRAQKYNIQGITYRLTQGWYRKCTSIRNPTIC